jgi:stage III sporulation protein SpoIIIAA
MDDVTSLLAVLPQIVGDKLCPEDREDLVEIIIDEGRPLEYRLLNDEFVVVNEVMVDAAMIAEVEASLGIFGPDNRAGIDYSLHRISRILNRANKTVGFTCRVGRPITGCVALLQDLVDSGKSILLLGKPGTGKTTKLRDIARVLSSDALRRVIVIDTSNEIAGDGNLPHPAIGRSRRMQVPSGKCQHEIMEEAVENHMPEVIIIDEISNERETEAARTIAQRGVQLIATAHGTTINELIDNPPLCGLIGGNKTVQIGDRLMRIRGIDTKTVHERQHTPTFDVVVELTAFDEVVIHLDAGASVDAILSGGTAQGEVRRLVEGKVIVIQPASIRKPEPEPGISTGSDEDFNRIDRRVRTRPSHRRDNDRNYRSKKRR